MWLGCSYPQLQLPGGLPFQQATVTVKFKMASKMATAVMRLHTVEEHLRSTRVLFCELCLPTYFFHFDCLQTHAH